MTPEQLWEKYAVLMYPPKSEIPEYVISIPNFHAALAEYGEAVRAEAVSVLQVKSIKLTEFGCKNLATSNRGNHVSLA